MLRGRSDPIWRKRINSIVLGWPDWHEVSVRVRQMIAYDFMGIRAYPKVTKG